jgi:hypothetical protein
VITDVGIDIDGVMYDFANVFHEFVQNRSGVTLPKPQTWDFYKEWGMTDKDFDTLLAEGIEKMRIFDSVAPMKNTIEGWNLLKANGVKIHVLTHRGHLAYAQTVQWLTKYGLIPDSLHFGNDKTILKTIATDECAAVDDYTVYYDKYEKADILSFLRNQPWNEEKYARRVSDLLDFAEKVVMINNSKKALIELPNKKSQLKKVDVSKFYLENPKTSTTKPWDTKQANFKTTYYTDWNWRPNGK